MLGDGSFVAKVGVHRRVTEGLTPYRFRPTSKRMSLSAKGRTCRSAAARMLSNQGSDKLEGLEARMVQLTANLERHQPSFCCYRLLSDELRIVWTSQVRSVTKSSRRLSQGGVDKRSGIVCACAVHTVLRTYCTYIRLRLLSVQPFAHRRCSRFGNWSV